MPMSDNVEYYAGSLQRLPFVRQELLESLGSRSSKNLVRIALFLHDALVQKNDLAGDVTGKSHFTGDNEHRPESEKIGIFGHGFTYSGHPVATAVALETLKIYEERDIVGHVQQIAPVFQRRLHALSDHPLVGNARGRGLIGTLELVRNKETKEPFKPADGIVIHAGKRAQMHGVVTRALGDNYSLCPPLIITEAQIIDMFDRSERALDDTYTWACANSL